MEFKLENILRANIKVLTPYSSARDEYQGKAEILLDANESPFDNGYNRYPDPLQQKLKARIAEIKNIPPENIALGNGSDELISLCMQAVCDPGHDIIVISSPTYGMYKVTADIQGIEVLDIPLLDNYQLNIPALKSSFSSKTKILFICSPNNPTGNIFPDDQILDLIKSFPGLVIVDQAYIDFTQTAGFANRIKDYPNLIVLQTLSKAWGLAAIRLGILFAQKNIINIINKIKAPYNINSLSQAAAINVLNKEDEFKKHVNLLLMERENLKVSLSDIPEVVKVYPSAANFLLVKFVKAHELFLFLRDEGIIVRDRSQAKGLEDCIRISIGTPVENKNLVKTVLKFYKR